MPCFYLIYNLFDTNAPITEILCRMQHIDIEYS